MHIIIYYINHRPTCQVPPLHKLKVALAAVGLELASTIIIGPPEITKTVSSAKAII